MQTADARDEVSSRRDELRRRLQQNPDDHSKLLLAGHRGCGKSTELVQLSEELKDEFFTVAFSVELECNIASIVVEDVLVVLMERLVAACDKEGLGERFSKATETLKEIYNWFSTELEIVEATSESGKSAEAGVSTEQTIWGKLVGVLAKAKTSVRHGDKHLHRTTLEKPNLIAVINSALHSSKRRLLAVIEDLDKSSLSDARKLFRRATGCSGELANESDRHHPDLHAPLSRPRRIRGAF